MIMTLPLGHSHESRFYWYLRARLGFSRITIIQSYTSETFAISRCWLSSNLLGFFCGKMTALGSCWIQVQGRVSGHAPVLVKQNLLFPQTPGDVTHMESEKHCSRAVFVNWYIFLWSSPLGYLDAVWGFTDLHPHHKNHPGVCRPLLLTLSSS